MLQQWEVGNDRTRSKIDCNAIIRGEMGQDSLKLWYKVEKLDNYENIASFFNLRNSFTVLKIHLDC